MLCQACFTVNSPPLLTPKKPNPRLRSILSEDKAMVEKLRLDMLQREIAKA